MLISPSRLRRNVPGAVGVGLLTVVFSLILLRANPHLFWNDDYEISILPVLADVARSWREGHWPLLSPYGWACANLAGEYQYGTFSLFINAVVVAVWQWPMSFSNRAAALSIVHLVVLAGGAFLLARRRRLPVALAYAVALAAALNGWIIGWGATDWFGALTAEAWLPWCWWAFEEVMWPRGRRSRLHALLPVPFVYLLLTAGFPYTVVMLGLVSAWLAVRAVASGKARALVPLIAGWLLGLGLAAPAWLSLLTYMAGSGRSQGVGHGNVAWTVPLSALPGLILPDWTTLWRDFANRPSTHAALELAGGFVPCVGLATALAWRRRALLRAVRWELGLAGIVLLLCILPSPGVFRWSFRWLPLFHLVLALSGGRALSLMLSAHRRKERNLWRCLAHGPGTWGFVAVASVWLVMTLAHTANADAITRDLPWLMLVIAACWMLLDAVLADRRRWAVWVPAVVTFASLLATYRHMYTNPGLPVYAFGPNLEQVAPLSANRLYLSLYREPDLAYCNWQTPPDFGAVLRPGSTAMFAGVHLINAYSPIMAQGIGRRLSLETHGNVPDDLVQELLRDESGADGLLARLGVDGLIIAQAYYPLSAPPLPDVWENVFSSPEGTVYHRYGGARPDVQAWTSDEPGGPRSYAAATVHVLDDSRLGASVEVDVPANGPPGLLAFRRAFFPGYVASLDGMALPVSSFQGLLPTVKIPAGSRGRLDLRYRPRAVVWGMVLAAVSLVGMGLFVIFPLPVRARWDRKKSRSPENLLPHGTR